MTTSRGGFPTRVALTLAKRAAFLCSRPDCRISTIGPTDAAGGSKNIGEAAHISGKRPGAARYDPEQTTSERDSVTNGIWLCNNHATEIDKDATAYPVELLEQWKQDQDSYVNEIFGERQRIYEDTVSHAHFSQPVIELLEELVLMMRQQLVVSQRISASIPWMNPPTGVVAHEPLISRARIAANGISLDDGKNVDTIGDLGTGTRHIMWAVGYADAEYDVFLTVNRKDCQAEIVAQTVDGVIIQIYDRDEWPQDAELRVYAVGDG